MKKAARRDFSIAVPGRKEHAILGEVNTLLWRYLSMGAVGCLVGGGLKLI